MMRVIGERQDWPITVAFLDRQSRRGKLGREMLAIAWLVALARRRRKPGEASCAMPYLSGVLGLAMLE